MHRFRATTLVAAGALAAGLTLGTATPASATAAAREYDARGDVTLKSKTTGLSRRNRTSIDLHWARVRHLDGGAHRLQVKLKRLAPVTTDWDQMVFFSFFEPGHRSDGIHTGFTHRPGDDHWGYDAESGTNCSLTDVKRKPRRGILAATLPAACQPEAGDVVLVRTATGLLNTDAPLWSADRLRFADPVT